MRIKELREEKNLSQGKLAEIVETSQRNIGRWENGENEPSYSQLIKLADFFNCSIDYLVGREDDLGNIVSTAPSTAPQDIFGDEATLLSCFRKLGTYEKEAILIQIKALAGAGEKVLK
ncbi:MAG: helix-turn-helix transcriptional regulator [Clostridia bacterium]|nr:helix-turn-helix transcriptional regulator [Clostridia bacterium]